MSKSQTKNSKTAAKTIKEQNIILKLNPSKQVLKSKTSTTAAKNENELNRSWRLKLIEQVKSKTKLKQAQMSS